MPTVNIGTVTVGSVVELGKAPKNKNKIKLRVPLIHGPTSRDKYPAEWSKSLSFIEDDRLPWVPVCFPVGTKDPDISSMFEEKEIVYVIFTGENNSGPLIIGTTGVKVKE